MPHVAYEDDAVGVTIMDDLVLKGVVEDEALALAPRQQAAVHSDAGRRDAFVSPRELHGQVEAKAVVRRPAVRRDARARHHQRQVGPSGRIEHRGALRATLDDVDRGRQKRTVAVVPSAAAPQV